MIPDARYYKLRAETSVAQGLAECNRCGVCCKRAPCLFFDYADLERVATAIGKSVDAFIAEHVQLERRRDGTHVVRLRAPCVFLASDNSCLIHPHRPRGAVSFECWTPASMEEDLSWTSDELAKLMANTR